MTVYLVGGRSDARAFDHIHFKDGSITEARTGVIASSVGTIRESFENAYSISITPKKPFYLGDGRWVYDIGCIPFDKNNRETCERALEAAFGEVIKLASDKVLTSVAFPPIGTRRLGYNAGRIADMMLEAALKFAGDQQTTARNIYFYFLSTDSEFKQVFLDRLELLKVRAKYISVLDPGLKEYQRIEHRVKQEFGSTAVTIHKISSIIDKDQIRKFKDRKIEVENALNLAGMHSAQAEQELWHGTMLECTHLIYKNGFDPKRAMNSKYDCKFGRGTYFAISAITANHYNHNENTRNRCLILCRVLTGKSYEGSKDVTPQTLKEGFHSTRSPCSSVFVIYSRDLVVPAYEVQYTIDPL